MSIFEEIRDGCRQVADKATRLRLDAARLADYARDFPVAEIGAATLDPATHYLGHGKDTLTFVLALDAINFGSGYFPRCASGRAIPAISPWRPGSTTGSRRRARPAPRAWPS